MNLSGDRGREAQASFRILRAQSLLYSFFVCGAECRLIEQFEENAGLRFEDGIDALGRDLRPASDGFHRHAGITLFLQELPGGFDNPLPGICRLAFTNEGFVGTSLGLCQTSKSIASFSQYSYL